jgi:outer membrane lipoprotein carrier protein
MVSVRLAAIALRGTQLLTAAAVASADTWGQSADADAILARAVQAYQRVTTLRADFVQTIDDPMLGSRETTRGEFLQQRPNKFAMRWRQPRGDVIVADGETLWVYLPSTTPNQVVRTALTGRAGESGDLIAEFLDRPQERFSAAYHRADSAEGREADVLALTPRERGAPYRSVRIWVDRGDHLVRRVEIVEASGATRRLVFERLRVNVTIPASSFTFRPPAGARVVDASH